MIVSKSKLSSLNLQSLSATQFNGLTEEMISLFQLSRLLPLHCYSQCSITLYLVQTASHKADHTLALITNSQKKAFNTSQLADPRTPTAKNYVQDLHAKMFSYSTIPSKRGKQSKFVLKSCLFRILSSAYLHAQDRDGRGQFVVWLQMNFRGHSEVLRSHWKACIWMECLFGRTEKLCMLDIHSRMVHMFLLRTL